MWARSFASLYQTPRKMAEEAAFQRSLPAMNQLYASAVGTTVLQLKEIPARPKRFDGAVCLFKLQTGLQEDAVRKLLGSFGEIVRCDLGVSPAIVYFATHDAALKAKQAGVPMGLCDEGGGIDTLYNEHPYDGRGWCKAPPPPPVRS